MKAKLLLLTGAILLGIQFIFPQNKPQKNIYFEAGINASLPVHIEMYRSHRLSIGINTKAAKAISTKWELGLRAEYDYRFIKSKSRNLTTESTLKERALHNNFSLISLKPNVQFNVNKWHFGAEAGIAYAISDEDSKIGFGFVEEYHDSQQFGACSALYAGRYFVIGNKNKGLDLSLNLTTFLANSHAENTLGLKLNYRFTN